MTRQFRHNSLVERSSLSLPMIASSSEESGALGEEDSLVLRASKGNEQAFGELLEIYQTKVFNFVLGRVRNRETAEDITQEVMVKAYFNLPRLRQIGKFKSWLFSIANNHLRDMMRKTTLQMVDAEGEEPRREPYIDQRSPIESVQKESRADLIRKALTKLPQEQQDVLTLCDIEGMSYKEIAEVMKIPLGTVQSRIFYARRKLKEILTEQFAYRGEW